MSQEIKESDYSIAAAIATAMYFVGTYIGTCIAVYVLDICFNTGFEFIHTILVWLMVDLFHHAYNMYYRTKEELKEHVEKNGGIL